jgi:hypothetical protein
MQSGWNVQFVYRSAVRCGVSASVQIIISTRLTFHRYNHVECVKALVLSGANINACVPSGTSALFVASYIGHAACVQVLLQAGADPANGSSCSECALQRGFPKISKLLEQYPPGCVEGLIFDSSAIFFKKWLRRFFVVSLSQGTISVSENSRRTWDISWPATASSAQRGDAIMWLIARDCCFTLLENFEGKQEALSLRSSSYQVSGLQPYLNVLAKSPLIFSMCRPLSRSPPSSQCN